MTKDIIHTSGSIFMVFNELNLEKEQLEFSEKFKEAFETKVSKKPIFTKDGHFRKLIE